MPRAAKSANALQGHRTKQELQDRRSAEAAIASGKQLTEEKAVAANPIAHKEFCRVKKLMASLDKNDALYSAVMNRYSLLYSECAELSEQKEKLCKAAQTAQEAYDRIAEELSGEEGLDRTERFTKMITSLSRQLLSFDSQIMAKRKMMFDIEKENSMTVAAGLRTIPKETPKAENPLLKVLSGEN